MSFDISGWNAGVPTIPKGARANSATMFNNNVADHYYSTTDTAGTVVAAGYFNNVRLILNVDDLIYCVVSDDVLFLRVTSTSSSNVTVIPFGVSDEGIYNVSDFGATGDGSTDDAASIQAAIDAASSFGGGEVFIPFPATRYLIGSKLTTAENVVLRVSHGSEIRMDNVDDSVLRIMPNSSVYGGRWHVVNASYGAETPLIHILCDSNANLFDRMDFHGFFNATVDGTGAGSLGIGVQLESTGGTGGAQYVNFFNIANVHMERLNKGLELRTNEDSGDSASFVSGNQFNNISFDHCIHGIYLDTTGTGTPSVSGNQFNNVVIQHASTTITGITLNTAECIQNCFNNVKMFDWDNASGSKTFQITAAATGTAKDGNLFTNIRGPISTQVSLGTNNVATPAIPS